MNTNKQKILIVDDEIKLCKLLEINLKDRYEIIISTNGKEALNIIKSFEIDLVLTDLRLPGINGISLLEEIKAINPNIPIIIMTAYGTIESAVEAMKKGAYDYLLKPIKIKEVELIIERGLTYHNLIKENIRLKKELDKHYGFEQIITANPEMERIIRLCAQISQTNEPVLIEGESGTGKELIARGIHKNSPRANGPFVAINCAAIPKELLESELFGHERGAFTGAIYTKKGKFEIAENGTLLLDEIAEMPLNLQSKILRAIEQYEITRIGGVNPINLNIRLICTSNRNLKEEVEKGNFRMDLYYRLNVLNIKIPPLRERLEDIPLLVNHFIEKYKSLTRYANINVSPEILSVFSLYHWPGNVRELENCIKRMLILSPDGNLTIRDIPSEILSAVEEQVKFPFSKEELNKAKKIARQRAASEVERKFAISLLSKHKGNISRAAREIGMNRRQFQALLKRNKIFPEDYKN
ncbi:sigma-54 dependent transcriptional regulator [Candidatus Aminicenantes bacterium AC-708-M15]|jgi:DNA-binding NtrC family response regulator|nr:sigma-54 dependent transcriptional regulator [SCandidatus Aminicenantes bacterium Aminicenantia_JdfR_composite]MCP2598362.1 sigma-54 dependent transcriptional regulator [Candidatus Aminicenantes bacterium AC-335-L06]MCP2604270.1 sigma-54 dependent transcriptional regulator [Candidatus Aminicenantes bacterium AC-708-M15]MCP2618917.1 sigma-54 dependent transcriptional regulator [Candidatus Aminicenantes bacterium AC-335-A11]MCP2620784.1 sigma-54 dependent transcriptional regulator [Candidatus 